MKARKRFGQNFLQDERVIDGIVDAVKSAMTPDSQLIEIGPGLGAITSRLVDVANPGKKLKVIEIDRDVAAYLLKRPWADKFELLNMDVLEFDFHAVEGVKNVAGNLPYNISTPILIKLAEVADEIGAMHFMLQKEVAERIATPPGGNNYGRLSVALQYHFDVEIIIDVPPESFDPVPKVDSAVVEFIPHNHMHGIAKDMDLLESVVKRSFQMRRKTLKNNLGEIFGEGDFEALGIDPQERAQNLSVADYVRMANHLFDKKKA